MQAMEPARQGVQAKRWVVWIDFQQRQGFGVLAFEFVVPLEEADSTAMAKLVLRSRYRASVAHLPDMPRGIRLA